MTRTLRVLIALAATVAAAEAGAVQRLAAADGDTVAARVSARELTRVGIEGGRIARVWGTAAAMEVQPDPGSGQVFIRPRARAPFSFFVRAESGETVTVLATPVDVPSETILIRLRKRRTGPEAAAAGPATLPYVARIRRLVRAMAAQDQRYRRVPVGEPVPLWREARLVLLARWPGTLVGEEYRLTNVSKAEMRLDERELAALGDDIAAVAIERHVLAPGASTRILIVRRPDHGRD